MIELELTVIASRLVTMGKGHEWTTIEQREFLQAWLPKFCKAQAERRQERFWVDCKSAWFSRWPEEITDADGVPMSNAERQKLVAKALKKRVKVSRSRVLHLRGFLTLITAAEELDAMEIEARYSPQCTVHA